MMRNRLIQWIVVLAAASPVTAAEPSLTSAASPERGYDLLLNKAYLPPDFHQATFDEVWKTWPEPLRSQAAKATPEQRRRLAYRRYGLVERPGDPRGRPLQYVVDDEGNWSMNCLACHQGQVAGQVIPGMPNSHFALETLTEEIRLTKLRLGRKLTRMDIGSLAMPLGTSNGTTNAVMFGVVLMNYRDADLNVFPNRPLPPLTHHDHDAPPWWNVRKKERLYADNFAPKGHRALMQFLLVRENGPEQFRQWEDDFRHIEAYIESLEAPRYPFAIDHLRAARGKQVFERACAECHGRYESNGQYPEKIVPLEVVATDPVRLAALSAKNREDYARSWFNGYGFNGYGEKPTLSEPDGYLAPPLDGVWATAPYFHNGSVPTLWHVLHPSERPLVWRRTLDGYDREKGGLEIEILQQMPDVKRPAERRTYFNTNVVGKSAAGHHFPDALTELERRAVLEYLKTL